MAQWYSSGLVIRRSQVQNQSWYTSSAPPYQVLQRRLKAVMIPWLHTFKHTNAFLAVRFGRKKNQNVLCLLKYFHLQMGISLNTGYTSVHYSSSTKGKTCLLDYPQYSTFDLVYTDIKLSWKLNYSLSKWILMSTTS